jgi:Tfp pilus assembly protein PilV
VKTTSDDSLPKEKPKNYSNVNRASTKEGVDYSVADITPADEKLLRQQLRIGANQDFVITSADYGTWKSTGKKSPEDYGKDTASGKPNPFQANYEGDVAGNSLMPQLYEKGKAPKAKPDPNNMREAGKNVKPLDKYATLTGSKNAPSRDLVVKGKAAKEDIRVPEAVEGPKGRTVARKKLVTGPERKSAKMYRKQKGGNEYNPSIGVSTKTVYKAKGPRLSEKIKYNREEKLAGARERVLGLSGVETEDGNVFYNKNRNKNRDLNQKQTKRSATGVTSVKRGEKTPGSAQRLKDIKALYDTDSLKYKDANGVERSTGAISAEKIDASKDTGLGGASQRKKMLNQAKSDIKDIGKLSRNQIKSTRKEGSAKGRSIIKAKEMKAEYKSAKRPAKFSKGTSTADLAKDVAAMKSTKTAAEMKTMKTSARSAMKEARGMNKTKEERGMIKSGVRNNRELAREARSYKGDIRKGLRMEKRDVKAIDVAAKTSAEKKAAKTAKGKTMKGTGYFTMSALNKTVPLSETKNSGKQAGTRRYTK